MPAAIILLVFLFGLAEVLNWIQSIRLPLPIFLVGGVVVAVVSNYDKRWVFPVLPGLWERWLGQTDGVDRSETLDLKMLLQQGLGQPLTMEVTPLEGGRSPKLPFED